MTATAHALIGGAIAAGVSNPPLGLALAVLSHPLADMVPHWNFGVHWQKQSKLSLFVEASLDLLIGVVLTYVLFLSSTNWLYLAGAIFLAELPDFLTVPYWLLNWRFPPFNWIYKFQDSIQHEISFIPGILTQIIAVLGVIGLFQFLKTI